jgi:hypothetical protein
MTQSMPADPDWFRVGGLHLSASLPHVTKLPLFALLTSPYGAVEMNRWKEKLAKTPLEGEVSKNTAALKRTNREERKEKNSLQN